MADRRHMRRMIAMLGCIGLWWFPGESTATCPHTTGRLKITELAMAYTLTPLYTRHSSAQRTLQLIFERLYDRHGQRATPRLATRWSISKNRRQVIFHLRQGVAWHDGKPFTARDVAFTLKAHTSVPHVVDSKLIAHVVKRVVVLHKHKIKVELRLPLADPLAHLDVLIMPAHHSKSILSRSLAKAGHRPKEKRPRLKTVKGIHHLFRRHKRKYLDTYLGWKPVGTGPLRYESWYSRKLTLKRHPKYWRGQVCLKKLMVQWIPDHTLALEVFHYGGVDVVPWYLPKHQAKLNKSKRNAYLHQPPSQAWWSLAFNMQHPYVRDQRVRQALALLFDRKHMARFVGVPRLGNANPFFGFGKGVKAKRAQGANALRRARLLLDRAGWYRKGQQRVNRKGSPLKLRLFWPYGAIHLKAIPLFYQDRLANEGIQLHIDYIRDKPMSSRPTSKARYAMYFRGHHSRKLPHLHWLFHSRSQRRRMGYQNKKVDGLLDRLLIERDPKQRAKWMQIIGQEVAYDQPHIFLWAPPQRLVHHQRVYFPKGVKSLTQLFERSDSWAKK